jgi:hypothetical protein
MKENNSWDTESSGNSDKRMTFSLEELVSVSEFTKNIKPILNRVFEENRRFVITCHGRPMCQLTSLFSNE